MRKRPLHGVRASWGAFHRLCPVHFGCRDSGHRVFTHGDRARGHNRTLDGGGSMREVTDRGGRFR
eukprot:1481028-Rhodomonas_salina.1